MKQSEVKLQVGFIHNSDNEVVGEVAKFTSGFCVVYWYDGRSPLEVFVDMISVAEKTSEENLVLQGWSFEETHETT